MHENSYRAIGSKLTRYLINISKMRFPMINCLEYAQQCQNGIFKITCRATTVPYSVMLISPRYYVNIGSMGNPLIPDVEKHALRPFYSLNLKRQALFPTPVGNNQ